MITEQSGITIETLRPASAFQALKIPANPSVIKEPTSLIILDVPVAIKNLQLIPTSPYFFKISQDQKKTVRPTTTAESIKLLSDLASLAKLLQDNGIDFYLSGGLSYEMHAREKNNRDEFKFSRKHSDIDLQVNEDNFEKLRTLIIKNKLFFPSVVYKRRIASEVNLEFWKKDIKSDVPNRFHLFIPGLPKVDIFESRMQAGATMTSYNDIIVKNDLPLDSGVSIMLNNRVIKLLNLAHIIPFKSDKRAQSLHDLSLVASI